VLLNFLHEALSRILYKSGLLETYINCISVHCNENEIKFVSEGTEYILKSKFEYRYINLVAVQRRIVTDIIIAE
jgi:hypothetical protein